ncbi:gibberellin-regulated protein 2-like [Papaver somniferum]|uniref:gibberellin-regulated protein 2-like n=1 Tax=Papaver somniferum TaxID=3469 RepID=UPI000E7025A9|nr:gibberellin-regulated protein 2-like [Papaver somniferum]
MATTLKMMTLFTVFCFLFIVELQVNSEGFRPAEALKMNCPPACAYRCSKSSRHKMCIRACNTCCQRCNCVPPGTSGNADVCPCYANMTTHGGRLKCP